MLTEDIIARLIDDHSISGKEAVTMMKDLFVNRFIRHDDSISIKPEAPKPGDVHVKYGIRQPMVAVAYGVTDPWGDLTTPNVASFSKSSDDAISSTKSSSDASLLEPF